MDRDGINNDRGRIDMSKKNIFEELGFDRKVAGRLKEAAEIALHIREFARFHKIPNKTAVEEIMRMLPEEAQSEKGS